MQVLTKASTAAICGGALRDVLAERVRQIDVEGFDLDHDLGHHPGELAAASASYLNTGIDQLYGRDHPRDEVPSEWPWHGESWRPGDARANLVKALALGLATLDRLDHAPADADAAPHAGELS